MVPVSLCATHATYFAVRVEPRQGWRRVTERLDQRGRLALQRLAVHRKRALAAGTVEDQRGLRRRSVQSVQRLDDAVPGAHDNAVRLFVGELDGGVRRQVRRADQAAIRGAP